MAAEIPKPTLHTRFDLAKDLVDLKGKVVLITGANSGIGFATVLHLLRAGTTKIYMGARSEDKAKAAIQSLHDQGLVGEEQEVLWHRVDLADPRDAKTAAQEFVEREGRLDVLINNAGEMYSNEMGKDGLVSLFRISSSSPASILHTNHHAYHGPSNISTYVFTKTLLPLLKQTAQDPQSDVRIVNVGSKVMYMVPDDVQFKTLDDLNVRYAPPGYLSNMKLYGSSKLAMFLWSQHLQTQLRPSPSLPNGITVLALHPGVVSSYTFPFPYFSGLLNALTRLLLRPVSAEKGALTSVFAAASKQVRDERERYRVTDGGGVFLTDKPVPGSVAKEVPRAVAERGVELREGLVAIVEGFLEGIRL